MLQFDRKTKRKRLFSKSLFLKIITEYKNKKINNKNNN
uniref:Uncharacterized protein n=1 Tax=Anguilla anguilla TaxID=7936 RepID=A0A0E9SVK4_ANGAN